MLTTTDNDNAYSSQSNNETDSLFLVGQDITEFNIAPNNAQYIKHLDLSYNLLEKVEGLQRFVGLRELILDNNMLSNIQIPLLPFLHTLSLNKNRVYDLDNLLDTLSKHTPLLEFLSLLGNPACPNELMHGDEEDYQNYRYSVINRLKYLKFLDSRPVVAAERYDAQNRVKIVQVVKALQENLCPDDSLDLTSSLDLRTTETTPLDRSQDMVQRAGFGKRSYKYKGKNSEGNKFISNDDL